MSLPLTGLRAWLVQRLSAFYMLLFTLYVTGFLLLATPSGFDRWYTWLRSPPVAAAWMLFFAGLLIHAWVGMRDILLDYVRALPIRLAALVVVAGVLLAEGVWVLQILLGEGS